VVTLGEAVVWALARSPDLGVFPYDLRAADARVLQAGLGPNPELSLEMEEFGGAGERRSFAAAETTIRVDQPIELGGKRARRKDVAGLDKELVQWDYRAARLDVMRETTRAFAAVLAAQERLALNDRLVELSRQTQTGVAQRVQAGKDSPVDELRADVALATSRIERQKAEKALTAARHALAAAWGGLRSVFEKAAGDFYDVAAPLPLDDMTGAVADNPDVARWQTEEDRRRATLRLEKARGMPDIAVGGGLRRFETTDDLAMVFGVTIPLPLFDHNQGGVLAATAELGKARRQAEAAQVRTTAALAEAAGALAAAYDEITTLRHDALPQAQRVFEAAQQGYQQGKFDYLYLLDAQRTLIAIQAQHIDSLEAYHRARADVERLLGGPRHVADKSISSGSLPEPVPQENSHEK
jgi:cobalt-zinc-cadmium efflux system outer membrane protein